MKPHKHAVLIKAWADGAFVQERYKDSEKNEWGEWQDFDGFWEEDESWQFRIRPRIICFEEYVELKRKLIIAEQQIIYLKMLNERRK